MQAIVQVPTSPTVPLDETRETLIGSARRRFGSIPADLLVDYLLRSSVGADFAVREAALEALHRRWAFAERDGLVIATRPSGERVLGRYTTLRRQATRPGSGRQRVDARRAMREARPYASLLESLSPLSASCDCPDHLRNSLGLCKHLLIVLDHVFSSRKRLAAATRERRAEVGIPRLVWDPNLPLSGELDRLSGLRLEEMANGSPNAHRRPAAPAQLLARVRRALPAGKPDPRTLGDLERRRALLALLAKALLRGGGGRALLDASPAARALVVEELARVERRQRHAGDLPEALARLRSLKRKLYPYQREGVKRFLSSGRLLLADDMGLGKTTQAIAACHALLAMGRVRRGLVIAPASLKPQWLREWQETTDVPAAVVDGPPAERARRYQKLEAGFLIISYEQLLRDVAYVQKLAPDIVVLDEAQRIKNYATKSAAYVKALAPEYRLVLTGTPMENRLEELASILDWVDDVALSPKWRLVPWYTEWHGDAGSRGRAGLRNLDTLRARVKSCLLRRVRREVLEQLPARTDTRVPVEMTPQQMEEHDALTQPIAQLLRMGRRRPLRQAEFLKLMQLLTQQRIISNGLGQLRFEEIWATYDRARPDSALLEGLFAPKLLELRRLIADVVVAQERKVVVFSQWRRMLRLAEWSLRDVLEAAGLRAVFFTGAEKPAQRTRSVADFHDDPRVRVMLLSDAGGVGLNLQRAASACINLELPWNPAVLEQRIGRIYRLGQKLPIDVYNLVSEQGIESRILGLVRAKQALFSGLFDGSSDEIRFDSVASFLTRVESLVDPGVVPDAAHPLTNGEAVIVDTDDGEDADEPAMIAAPTEHVVDNLPMTAPSPLLEVATTVVDSHVNAGSTGSASPIVALFDTVRVERTIEGGVRIEAPPEAAGSLIALFEGLAKLLSAVAQRP